MTTGTILFALRLLLVLALYSFLGWGLYLIWQDLRRQSRMLRGGQLPTLALHARDDGSTQVYRFSQLEVTVGRDPASDCALENSTISGRHARLSYHHAQWWVEDLDSTNGTFLNGQPVEAAMVLAPGDELQFGQVQMLVSLESQPSLEIER